MLRRTGRDLAIGLATGVVILAAGMNWAAAAAVDKATYADRLRLPYRDDRLGISRSVTVDRMTGEIFVCDWRYERIVIFDDRLLFRHIMSGDRFSSSPNEVAVDPEGFLLVLPSTGAPLRYLDFDGAYLGELNLLDLPPNLHAEPRLVSIALSPDGKTVYALDGNNQRVWLAGRDGRVRHSIDLGSGLTKQERQDFIFGHVDVYDRTLIVAVPTNGEVLLFDLEGQPEGSIGLAGTTPCQTAFPVAAALDSEGRLLVLDNQRAVVTVWRVEGNECLTEFAGFGNAPGGLYRPLDLALDAQGRVFISQGFEGRVQVYQHSSPAAGTKTEPEPVLHPAPEPELTPAPTPDPASAVTP
jgi:DNA-binding beta-propeller fold protein YncE